MQSCYIRTHSSRKLVYVTRAASELYGRWLQAKKVFDSTSPTEGIERSRA